MKNAIVFLSQVAVICFIYIVSDFLVGFFRLPIPASVFGLIILFLLLLLGIIKVRYIEKAALFFNKHLAFFFIPLAVGLMNYGGLIKTSGLPFLIMIVGSSIFGLCVSAGLTQVLSSKKAGVKSEQSNFH